MRISYPLDLACGRKYACIVYNVDIQADRLHVTQHKDYGMGK